MNTKDKKNLVFLSGGISAEREIALLSAQHIYQYLDRDSFTVFPVYIAPNGVWYLLQEEATEDWPALPQKIRGKNPMDPMGQMDWCRPCSLLPVPHSLCLTGLMEERYPKSIPIDLFFPVFHGPFGEDGTFQGLAEFFQIPIVGSQQTGSLVNMDKVLMKALLNQAKLPCARYYSFTKQSLQNYTAEDFFRLAESYFEEWSCPSIFVKPARMGSSIGMSQIKEPADLQAAIQEALSYDQKILLEEGFCAIELEFGVVETEPGTILISEAAQIQSRGVFYSFEQKYYPERLENALVVEERSDLPQAILDRAKNLVKDTFFLLEVTQYARVDLFYIPETGSIMFNEINTIPGFTQHSMFPKLMTHAGWPMERLIPHLLHMASAHSIHSKKNSNVKTL